MLEDELRRRRKWLSEVPLFKGVARDVTFLQALARKIEVRTIRRKIVVIDKGDIGHEMFFIVRGEVDVLASLEEPPCDLSLFCHCFVIVLSLFCHCFVTVLSLCFQVLHAQGGLIFCAIPS